jgi:hypothetical protein
MYHGDKYMFNPFPLLIGLVAKLTLFKPKRGWNYSLVRKRRNYANDEIM